jgi:hypothetical protein
LRRDRMVFCNREKGRTGDVQLGNSVSNLMFSFVAART